MADEITREEQFLSAAAGNEVNLPTPITREEMFLAKAAGVNINITMLDPITRKERYLHALAESGGGGASVKPLEVIANGEYSEEGVAYSPVTVDVPNSYAAADEGKVVSNGALVEQTAHAEVTENGTIDTTLNNSVVVNVPTGGGSDVATGTITFENAQDVSAAVDKVSITHNLGRIPVGFAWLIIDTDAANLSGDQISGIKLSGGYLSGGEYITDTAYVTVRNLYSSGADFNVLFKNNRAHSVFSSLTSDSTTMLIFTANASRAGTIPAGTTIRWWVW